MARTFQVSTFNSSGSTTPNYWKTVTFTSCEVGDLLVVYAFCSAVATGGTTRAVTTTAGSTSSWTESATSPIAGNPDSHGGWATVTSAGDVTVRVNVRQAAAGENMVVGGWRIPAAEWDSAITPTFAVVSGNDADHRITVPVPQVSTVLYGMGDWYPVNPGTANLPGDATNDASYFGAGVYSSAFRSWSGQPAGQRDYGPSGISGAVSAIIVLVVAEPRPTDTGTPTGRYRRRRMFPPLSGSRNAAGLVASSGRAYVPAVGSRLDPWWPFLTRALLPVAEAAAGGDQDLTDADTATAGDTVTARGAVSGDTVTAADSDAAGARTAADTATAVDASGGAVAGLTAADTAAAGDGVAAAALTGQDTAAAADAPSSAARTDTDAATAADAPSARAATSADTATAVDVVATLDQGTTQKSDADTGTTADTVTARGAVSGDTVAAADADVAGARTAADTATAVDAVATLDQGTVAKTDADTAAAVDVVTARATTDTDTAAGGDSATARTATAGDTATPVDVVTALDTGATPKSATDTATATDTAVARAIFDADTAAAVDVVTARAASAGDTVAAEDAPAVRALTHTDTAGTADAAALAVNHTVAELLAAADAVAARALTALDTTTGIEGHGARTLTGQDTAAAAEASNLLASDTIGLTGYGGARVTWAAASTSRGPAAGSGVRPGQDARGGARG